MARPKSIAERKTRSKRQRRATEIRRGDMVQVIAGDDKGKVGKVLRVLAEKNRVIIERVNLVKRHTRARKQGQQAGILEREAAIHVSNVLLFDPKADRGVRVGMRRSGSGSERISKASGETIGRA